jgi:hypothetical protein
MRASELRPHPQNARRHPDTQARSLEALIREVGQVGELYAYRSDKLGGALTLLDGHLRLERFPDSEWEIAVTDLTDAEVALMLASRDRVTELAEWDAPALNELRQQVPTTDGDITEVLSQLAEEAGTKDVARDGLATATGDAECEYPLTPVPGEKYDYILIFYDNESDFANLQTMLKVAPKRDYKSSAVAPGRVIRFREFKQFIEEIARNAIYGSDPTAGRADRVKAVKAIQGDLLCVPASEARAYESRRYGVEVVAHPNTLRGLAAKRQWIADKFGDVFMVDDDVRAFVRLWLPTYRRDYRPTAQEARDAAEATHETAKEMGVYLFGFAFFGDTRLFRRQKPFLLTGYVNGCCFGLRAGSKLKFRTDVVAVEDMALSGMNAYHDHYLFVDQRFGPRQEKTFAIPGGQALHRTAETVRRDTETLRRLIGAAVVEKRVSPKIGKTRHRTVAQRSLRILF